MRPSAYHEPIPHRTGDFPLGYYYVDRNFPRYRMSAHWHKEVEIIRVRSGSLRLYLDDQAFDAVGGDLVSVGGGVIHSGEPTECVYECIVFDLEALTPAPASFRASLTPLLRDNLILKNRTIEANPGLRASVEELFRLASTDFIGSEIEMLGAIFRFLGEHLKNLDAAQLHAVSERTFQKAEQIKPALEYIERHYAQHITLETLARLSGFSPKYFCRYFRAIVHRSPIDYLNYYRVECAAGFLAGTDMNVAEVAVNCGFSDSSAFIKQFRRYKGVTPKQYKLRAQAAERL